MKKGVRPAVAPRPLRVSLPDFFKNSEQHDCSEFAKLFLDKLETELKSCNLPNIIENHLGGININTIECLECGTITTNKEPFIDLPVSFS
jgi:hypothetical protein